MRIAKAATTATTMMMITMVDTGVSYPLSRRSTLPALADRRLSGYWTAMSEKNVEAVRRGLESFLSGEPEWGTLHQEVEIQDHDLPEHGEYRGHEGFSRWLQSWEIPWAEWSLQPEEFIDAGDRVVVIAHLKATGRGSGAEVERMDSMVCELRDGQIIRIDYCNNREQALEIAGLAD
jgi:ketosteroid isomerase-like protein